LDHELRMTMNKERTQALTSLMISREALAALIEMASPRMS